MKIDYINLKEIFNKYYRRFLNYINPLNIDNYYKIKILK